MGTSTPIRYVDVDGLQVAYQLLGEGPVDLLQVPGHQNHIEAMWDVPEMAAFAERLSRFCRLILMDKRGTGLSDPLPSDRRATVEERVHDVWAVLDEIGSTSTVLYGTGDGSPVAIMAAAMHPERVKALTLYASSARLLEDVAYPGLPEAAIPQVLAQLRDNWANEDATAAVGMTAPSLARDPRWRSTFARIQRLSSTPRAAAEYWEANLRVDVRAALPLVAAPTLVMHCKGDRVYPLVHGRYVAANVPDAQLVELDGTDHFSFVQNGERIADEIEEFLTGHRPGTHDNRRLATVMFTDIVGSTEHERLLGDARWRALLDLHDHTIARQVERYRGVVVKTTGDGCLAIFDGPETALRASQVIRAACESLGITLRIGLHTGGVEQRVDDVVGVSVNLAARVLATAEPGAIWLTRTVRDLVAGSMLDFVDRGDHDLKGFDEPWRLYELTS